MQLMRKGSRRLIESLINSRRFVFLSSLIQFVIDMVIWSLTAIAASYARFEYQGHHDPFGATKSSVFRVLPIVLVVHAVVGYIVGIYRRRWRYGSFDEVGGLVLATFITTSVLQVVRFWRRWPWVQTSLTSVQLLLPPMRRAPARPINNALWRATQTTSSTATCSRGCMATTWRHRFAMPA